MNLGQFGNESRDLGMVSGWTSTPIAPQHDGAGGGKLVVQNVEQEKIAKGETDESRVASLPESEASTRAGANRVAASPSGLLASIGTTKLDDHQHFQSFYSNNLAFACFHLSMRSTTSEDLQCRNF